MKNIGSSLPLYRGGHRIVLTIGLLVGAWTGAGCYPKAGPPPGALSPATVSAAATRWPGATEGSLQAGRDLFLKNCNSCHDYPDLAAIPDERWPHILDKMARKADLDPGQRDAVLHFVLASRSEQGPR